MKKKSYERFVRKCYNDNVTITTLQVYSIWSQQFANRTIESLPKTFNYVIL